MDLQQLLGMLGGRQEPMVTVPNYGDMTLGDFEVLKKKLGLPETMKPEEFPTLNPGIVGSGYAEGAGASLMERNNRLKTMLDQL